jgi:cytosine/adenosine deaminase-related metal-dependent hydrolase
MRAYVGGTVIAAPDAAPIADGAVLIDGERIVAVGPRASVAVPPGAHVVDCHGTTVVAAFWNTHVHFTEPRWADAAHAPAASLEESLRAMLGRWGFAHVFDTGSNIADTGALRRRIEGGEIAGPHGFMRRGAATWRRASTPIS